MISDSFPRYVIHDIGLIPSIMQGMSEMRNKIIRDNSRHQRKNRRRMIRGDSE